MDRLKRLILDHEDWLIDRVVRYAHEQDYARYTSTLREAWRASIVGLSQPLVAALNEIPASDRPTGAPIRAAVAFGVEEARKHQTRGTDIGLFLGLLKFYRRSYFDLVAEKVTVPADRHRLTTVLLEMFDSIELGLVREWMNNREDTELERLRAKNRELSNEKNKYLTVFESIAEPTILLDSDDEPLHINTAGGRMLLGESTPGAGYYGAPDIDRLRLLVTEILARTGLGGGAPERVTLETAIGPRIFSIAQQEMLDISSKFAGRVIILKDITDYLAAIAAAEDANRAKTAFLTTVSHEIKTPINSIIGLTKLVADGGLTEEQQRHVGAIRQSGKLLSELIENILGMSRAEANALQRVDQDFNLRDLVEGLLIIVGPDAQARGLSIGADFSPGVPCLVRGDAQKLRHVLMNLLSNALKFTARGGVTVRIAHDAAAAPESPVVRFEVADTGAGLPAGATDWLFEPFTQYHHPGLGAGPRGTGLGLAICKRLVSFLGGTISARQDPAGGSVFSFDLPFAAASRATTAVRADTALAVLLVEDDPVNALVAEGYLARIGHKAVVAHSYAAALRHLESERFDLVITDNLLDEGTGLDLALYLRGAADPGLQALPVIVVTAAIPDASGTPPGTVQQFVEKPFDGRDLDKAIRQAMAAGDVGARHHDAPQQGPVAPAPQTAARSGEAPLFEPGVLNQLLTDLGVERCGRIVESYMKSSPRLGKALARGLAAEDLVAVSDAAHQMISAASFVGLTSVAALARDLHRSCAARELRAARAIHADLQGLSRQANDALARHWAGALEGYGGRA